MDNPFSYNYISLNKSKVNDLPLPSPAQMMATPSYNAIGKFLGVDFQHDWNKEYPKVHAITEWAIERSGKHDPIELVDFIGKSIKNIPSLGAKKIDDLYERIKLMGEKHD